MRCPHCSAEAGDAANCPSCGKPVASAPAAADVATAAVRSGWRNTFLTIAIAVVLGVIAGYLARKLIGPAPDPICGQLCQFADVPAVVNNPAWKQQVADAHCRCDQVPRTAPVAQPVQPVIPPVVPAPPPQLPPVAPAGH